MDIPEPGYKIDFTNTEIAFSNKSDKELKNMAFLFYWMNKPFFVNLASGIGLFAVKFRLPFAKSIIRKTIFPQFVGGENLLDCQKAIDKLYKFNTLTILDYGAEGKSSEEELNAVMQELTRAVDFAASNNSVPVVSTKLTGLVDNEILIKIQAKEALSTGEKDQFQKFKHRVNTICSRASELGVGVFVDAEESWLQEPIDRLVEEMMIKYNKEKVIVYNTFQLYLTNKLKYLNDSLMHAKEHGYMLGAKLVRGAYMEKERERAEKMGYPSPIHQNKDLVDKDFNDAVEFCVENYQIMGSCVATHNLESSVLQARLIEEKGILKTHPHLNFCQLYGMGDHITFNIVEHGFNVAKYVPYGEVREVIPYLIRRAKENTSVSGEMSREFGMVKNEIKRRGI